MVYIIKNLPAVNGLEEIVTEVTRNVYGQNVHEDTKVNHFVSLIDIEDKV